MIKADFDDSTPEHLVHVCALLLMKLKVNTDSNEPNHLLDLLVLMDKRLRMVEKLEDFYPGTEKWNAYWSPNGDA